MKQAYFWKSKVLLLRKPVALYRLLPCGVNSAGQQKVICRAAKSNLLGSKKQSVGQQKTICCTSLSGVQYAKLKDKIFNQAKRDKQFRLKKRR